MLYASHKTIYFLSGVHPGVLMECVIDFGSVGFRCRSRVKDGHDAGIAFTADESAHALAKLDQHIGGAVSVHKIGNAVTRILLLLHQCASHWEGQSYDYHRREAVTDTINAFPHRTGGKEDTISGSLEIGNRTLIAPGHADGIVLRQSVLQQFMHKL